MKEKYCAHIQLFFNIISKVYFFRILISSPNQSLFWTIRRKACLILCLIFSYFGLWNFKSWLLLSKNYNAVYISHVKHWNSQIRYYSILNSLQYLGLGVNLSFYVLLIKSSYVFLSSVFAQNDFKNANLSKICVSNWFLIAASANVNVICGS